MSTPGLAVPGTVVPSGVLVTPGGSQGIQGVTGPQGPAGPVSGPFVSLTGAYTVVAGDLGKYFICTGGAWTMTLPAAASGFWFRVRNDMVGITIGATTGTITLVPPAGTIDGATSRLILPGQECTLISDGTNWRTFGLQRVVAFTLNPALPANTISFLLPLGFRDFEIELDALTIQNDQTLELVFSTNGGASWINASGAYYWTYGLNNSPSAWVVGVGGGSTYGIAGQLSANGLGGKVGVKVCPGVAGIDAYAKWTSQWTNYYVNGGTPQIGIAGGSCSGGATINAISFYNATSVNFNTGIVTVKGIV